MVATNIQSVYSDGIYHGLPVIAEKHSGLAAIVVGASGMSGQSMIDVLLQTSPRWKKVYALSRRPPDDNGKQDVLEHVPVDLLKDPSETSDALKKQSVRA